MRALTITAGGPGVSQLPEPAAGGSDLVIDGLLLGVCGTDRNLIARGAHRLPPVSGIRGQDGYGAERYLLDEQYAVRVDRLGLLGVLIEPASKVAKAWERIDASVRRTSGRALIFGAGPIGLLAALLH